MKVGVPRSLLGQFIALHAVIAVAAAIILFASATTLLHQTADHFQRDLLRRQAAVSTVPVGTDSPAARVVTLSNGMAVSVVDGDRRVTQSYGAARPEVVAAAPLGTKARFFRVRAIVGLSVPQKGGWIIVSQDGADPAVVTDDIVRSFLPRFALICLPIAALVPLIGAFLARRLTLRMRAVSLVAGQIGPRSLDIRLPRGQLPLEAEPLAEATNAALDRLAAAIQVQTAFAADVAHELRTPLAVVRLRADAVADPAARAALLSSVDRAARVIDQLLALADLERPLDAHGEEVDLHALAERVVVDRAPAVFASGRTIALEPDTAPVRPYGYPEALALALENLVDNAVRHTPPGTAIVVRSGPGPRLTVSDDGPLIPEADLVRLTDRLWRGAGSSIEGSGIGLSIVDRVARAHGGRLRVCRGPSERGLVCEIVIGEG
ncbi:two-component sensor histidine kinase [Sphingomonas sp. HMWF008]|nr:two-component sensor histidine kinase [Sphingomonas sp. HMWF008]